jgi:acyl-CoA synthetase (AMP-forming)/AMP-acid ligase II
MAGAPVPAQLIQDFKKVIPNGEIHTPYGATETLPVSSISGSRILEETKLKSDAGAGTCVGRPVAEMNVKIIRILDEAIPGMDAVEEVPQRTIGEIIVQGPVVTKAYDHLQHATAKAKIPDGDHIWHRMGDTGYLDEEGSLWFCGRVAERGQTDDGVLYTDPVEALFNQQEGVFRSALIGLGKAPHQTPAIVIEPEAGHWPENKDAENNWAKQLLELIPEESSAAQVKQVFFHKAFPVDVRHNAKIHRLTLAKAFEREIG